MYEVVYALAAIGILPYVIGLIVAYSAISLYFKFMDKN